MIMKASWSPSAPFTIAGGQKRCWLWANAQLDQRFAADRMIQKHGIRSIVCIPALHQGELKAMLYLENRQMPDVFTLGRVEIPAAPVFSVRRLGGKCLAFQQPQPKGPGASGRAKNATNWPLPDPRPGSGTGTLPPAKVYYSDRLKELLGYAPDELRHTGRILESTAPR